MATLNRTFSVRNGLDVANTVVIDSNRNLVNVNVVNANTFITSAGLNVTDQANNAYSRANLAYGQANTAYDQANSAYLQANTAYGQANAAYLQANSGFQQANAAYGQANAAYLQANTAYNQANAAYAQANTGLSTANGAYGQANAAYAQANNAANTVAVSVAGGSTLYNKQLNFVNTATSLVNVIDSGDGKANIQINVIGGGAIGLAYDQANAAYGQANAGYSQANTAYNQANASYTQANVAYGAANTAYQHGSDAYDQANLAYNTANTKAQNIIALGPMQIGSGQTNNVWSYSFDVNVASTSVIGVTKLVDATNSTDTANAATPNSVNAVWGFANTMLPQTGGTINGSLNVSGNLFVTGNTSYINVSTFVVSDPLIYLASNNYLSDIVDIGFVGGHNTSGVYQHSGLVRHATEGVWYLFTGLPDEGHQNNVIDIANTSLATLRANIEANSILLTGNVVATQGNLTLAFNQANAARTQANTAYDQANAAYAEANIKVNISGASMNGGLIISTTGYGLTVGNANIQYTLTVGALNVTTNTVTTSFPGQVVLDTFPIGELASSKYFVQANSGLDYHTTEIVLVQDQTNVWLTEYGSIQTGPFLGSFTADINSGNVRLLFNATNATNTIRSVRYGIRP